jgi:hypothetical protein
MLWLAAGGRRWNPSWRGCPPQGAVYGNSFVIGVTLAVVAVFLAYESKGLLVGESTDTQAVASIWAKVEGPLDVIIASRGAASEAGRI